MKRNCSDHGTVMGDPVNFPSNILFFETVSVRITRARSNRECILLLSVPPLPFEFLSQLCTNLHAPWTSLVLVLLARCVCVCVCGSVELPPRVSPPCPGDTDSSRREERGELFSFKSTWPFRHLSALFPSRFPFPPSPFSRPRRFVRASRSW